MPTSEAPSERVIRFTVPGFRQFTAEDAYAAPIRVAIHILLNDQGRLSARVGGDLSAVARPVLRSSKSEGGRAKAEAVTCHLATCTGGLKTRYAFSPRKSCCPTRKQLLSTTRSSAIFPRRQCIASTLS